MQLFECNAPGNDLSEHTLLEEEVVFLLITMYMVESAYHIKGWFPGFTLTSV